MCVCVLYLGVATELTLILCKSGNKNSIYTTLSERGVFFTCITGKDTVISQRIKGKLKESGVRHC